MTRSQSFPSALTLLVLTVTSCGGGGGGPSPTLANFEVAGGNAQAAPAGHTLPNPLVVQATDEQGDPIPGVTVEFTAIEGGGQVNPASATTGNDGRASTRFTLGPAQGNGHRVEARVPETDFTVTFTATGGPPAATLEVAAGSGQSAPASAPVPVAPAVRVLDGDGNPSPGVEVQFAVASGGGAVTGALAATDASGVATVGQWTLGSGGVNTVTATAPGEALEGDPALFVATVRPATGFNIEVRHQGTPSASQLLAFAEAEVRWEEVIAGDVPGIRVTAGAGQCGTGSPAVDEEVDDLLILANLRPIDGPGSVLGAAGPCVVRASTSLPAMGQMRFDTDDLELLEENEILRVVILHEMGHALGFGTIWTRLGLLADAAGQGGTDPHFTGPLAITAFNNAGGASYPDQKVPVEDDFGPGTADSHWRESVLGRELMTGFIGVGLNPLSSITIQSLADMGYVVAPAAAEPFTLGAALRSGPVAGPTFELRDDIARGPVYMLDERGRVVGRMDQ